MSTRNHGVLCLKSYPIPEAETRFIAHVFTHISENNFNYGPKTLLTINQAPGITRNEVHYMITNWVIGTRPHFHKKNIFKKAIRTLAKFHSAAQGIPSDLIPEARIRYNGLRERITSYRKILSDNPKMQHLLYACDEALDRLDSPTVIKAIAQEQTVSAFVHGDFNYPNLVLDTSGSIHMIDFDNTSLNVRMQDLAHILHRNFPWQGKETLSWINYYERKRSLSVEDRHLLYTLLLLPYPVIRALQQQKRNQHLNILLPTTKQVKNYKEQLKKLL
ncbi:aminoglycoside phosphotransferase family protein [Paenibacillus sp. N3.4]|uniref:aminoglycoside phosphotransferase family protein n=1 Tax=Paenibacillus sp. N3.4 TaxID=2603222 RepID=UPI001C9CF4FA|nr:aminoglycoside phosphotransferase family protein [Paenibacillus sp. N3.4]